MAQSNIDRFKVTNLGPIAEADVEFGDLTILTGPQATGKTLFLETFNLLSSDTQPSIEANNLKTNEEILDYFYGENMHKVISDKTKITINAKWEQNKFENDESISILDFLQCIKEWLNDGDKECNKGFSWNPNELLENHESIPNLRRKLSAYSLALITPTIYYIPAQRSLALSEGRIKTPEDYINSPYVLIKYSNYLQQYTKIFTKRILRDTIDNFELLKNANIYMRRTAGSPRLEMTIKKQTIPYMAWSTGQRELTPLLMALDYYGIIQPRPEFVVIEEPELGLHPRAIIEFMLTVLKIMQTGTKVIISTHSSTPLDFVWTIKHLKEKGAKPSELAKMFDFKIKDKTVFDNLFEKTFKTYYFAPDKKTKKVYTKDISSLDVYSEDEDIATWGGMSLSADRAGSIVSRL